MKFNTSSPAPDIGSLTCRDLLDVCQAQQQFAPSEPLPTFGGPKGADVTASLLGIQAGHPVPIDSLRRLYHSSPTRLSEPRLGVRDMARLSSTAQHQRSGFDSGDYVQG